MKKKVWAAAMLLVSLMSGISFAEVVAGDDLDGGANNGGFTPISRVLTPDNTAWNGLFGESGSRFDRFGIANRTVEDDMGVQLGLPFDVLDDSLSFAGDRWGIIREDKTDNVFVMVDLENDDNETSPRGTGTWTFDISDYQDLSMSIDLAMIGDFGTDGSGRNDSFTFSYAIDGGASQTLLQITSTNDNRGYFVVMADGNEYLTGGDYFFFNEADYNLLGCNLVVDNSCAPEFDVFGDGSQVLRPDVSDVNQDGHIYVDDVNATFPDTPIDPNDLTAGAIRIYQDSNSFGTFSQPELELYRNPLMVNGDTNRLLGNQLATFTESIAGTGGTLTLTLDAEQYGGDQYFVFDNILIEGTPAGGVSGDFNDDGKWDCADIDMLVAKIVDDTDDPDFDMNGDGMVNQADITDETLGWLKVGGENNPTATGGGPFLEGDANLDGGVDVSDFNAWNDNKFTSIAAWCSGDFTANGVVDVSDFNKWNDNKFRSSMGNGVVPEPAAGGLLLLGLLGMLYCRR